MRGRACSRLLFLSLKILKDTVLKPQRREGEISGVHFVSVFLKVPVQGFELEIRQEFVESIEVFPGMVQVILERITVLQEPYFNKFVEKRQFFGDAAAWGAAAGPGASSAEVFRETVEGLKAFRNLDLPGSDDFTAVLPFFEKAVLVADAFARVVRDNEAEADGAAG